MAIAHGQDTTKKVSPRYILSCVDILNTNGNNTIIKTAKITTTGV